MTGSRRGMAPIVVGVLVAVAGTVHAMLPVSAQTGQLPETSTDLRVETLSEDTQDPTSVGVLPDGRVVWAERTGRIKVRTLDGKLVQAGRLKVAANSCNDCPDQRFEEGGVHGLLVDRDYAHSGRIFLYYSVPNSVAGPKGEGKFRLSTFVLRRNSTLDLGSEKMVLENPAEWAHCCHYGGDLAWMPDGTIVQSVGDDTSPREEMYNPRDHRAGREAFNAERTAQNPADRRGKVLRFRPDGTAPPDNPFVGRKGYDPLVYAMGFRSNYRLTVDAKTSSVFVGVVGPDAATPDPDRGPEGHEEVDIIPKGGGTNHGWPRCIGKNMPYQDYDYVTGRSKGPLSCKGMTPAALDYNAFPSANQLPLLAGARTMLAASVYRTTKGALRLPDRLRDHFLMIEWSRDLLVSSPTDGRKLDIAGLRLELHSLRHPIDAAVGPDGALYVAEYGEFYYNNNTSRISRITRAGATPSAADYKVAGPYPADVGTIATAPQPRVARAALSPAGTKGRSLPPLVPAGVGFAAIGVVRRRRIA